MTTWKVNSKYQKIGDGVWTCVGIHNGVPLMLHANGRDLHNLGNNTYFEQMFSEHKEPITVEGWVNVYDPPVLRAVFSTLEEAKLSARNVLMGGGRKLVAVVHVKGTSDEP